MGCDALVRMGFGVRKQKCGVVEKWRGRSMGFILWGGGDLFVKSVGLI